MFNCLHCGILAVRFVLCLTQTSNARQNPHHYRMHTRIKICGITQRPDAQTAALLGASAIGLVFYSPSPRAVSIAQAREVISGLPPFVSVVGLFVCPKPQEVRQVLDEVAIDILQFHGSETAQDCERYHKPYIKAVRMQPGLDMAHLARQYQTASALLLDAYHPTTAGGTGRKFDWDLCPQNYPLPIVLAGGLSPGNVREAVQQVQPYAVDVSSGVETSKGIKNTNKMAEFIQQTQSTNIKGATL